jgi:hypothetical protein
MNIPAKLESAFDELYRTWGDQLNDMGFTDTEIKDTLWFFFFDVDKSWNWLLGIYLALESRSSKYPVGEHDKRIAARDRKGKISPLSLSLFPFFFSSSLRHLLHLLCGASDQPTRRCSIYSQFYPALLIVC